LERVRAELKENDRQWEAFTRIGHCVVLAPPGSGKTKLLTARLGEDLLSIIPPAHGAACVTLTNAAADELRRRIDSLGVGRRSTLFVGTVHSFALNSIVLPFAQAAGELSLGNVRVATRAQQDKAFSTALRETYSHGEDVRYVRSTLERCRKLAHDDAWYRAGEAIRHLNRCYTALLRAQGVIDFDGIVEAAVDLVERHASCARHWSLGTHGSSSMNTRTSLRDFTA
jgi:DNA helicase-2/ATP-dependent DNA helicase PcrA